MNIKTTALVTVALAASSVMALQHGRSATTDKPVQAKVVKGVQVATVTVANGKYSPSVIKVKKGLPVVLTFVGGDHLGCGGTVEFKSLKQKLVVKQGTKASLKFKPEKAGEVAFACPMDMYKGKVVVN